MCIQHILMAGGPLPEVRDDPDLPDLLVQEIAQDEARAAAVRCIASAPFLYSIRPSELCGCYFKYDRAAHEARLAGANGDPPLSGEELRISQWIWRQGHNAVNSFARYLERHIGEIDLALYVCWEHEEGGPIEQRETVGPAFFGGASFVRLPENAVFTLHKEGPKEITGGAMESGCSRE